MMSYMSLWSIPIDWRDLVTKNQLETSINIDEAVQEDTSNATFLYLAYFYSNQRYSTLSNGAVTWDNTHEPAVATEFVSGCMYRYMHYDILYFSVVNSYRLARSSDQNVRGNQY